MWPVVRSTSAMEFRILGPLEVVDEGRSLPLGGGRQRALLASLLLRVNQVVASDQLLDEVWGETPPASGLRGVQVYVSALRKILGDGVIVTRAPGYVLTAEPEALDLHRFERLVGEARDGDPAARAAKLREALALWRGPPLADFAYASFAQSEIGRLEELRLSALEARIEADLRLGRHTDLVGELEALVAEHPLREGLRAQLMLALYRAGRQAEALEAYQQARTALVDELGIEPGRDLRDLEQAILRQDPSLDLVPDEESEEDSSRGAFVGRHAELEEVLAGLEDALAGRGRLFLLVGEPGIGKSRLSEEVGRRARARGARVLVGRCWEAGGAPAYWPWVQALRGHVRSVEPEALRAQLGAGAAEVAQILPELRELLPGLPELASEDSEGARFRLFDATADLLRRASESRPIVLVLDDLHAADAPSLLLLQFLVRDLGSTPMLVLGAYRDVDPTPGHLLTATLAEVAREPMTRRIALGGLSERDVGEYLELTAAEIASPELVAALHERTEGNPLFVGETVRLLALEGGDAGPVIPDSVRDVIARRLGHLSEECNRVLVLASVLGREFALDALARVAEISVEELLDTLDEAVAARVVSDVPGIPGRLRFAHVLIRDSLYEGLTTTRRVRLHRMAGEALGALYGDQLGPHLAELAHHSIAGSDFDNGLRYARQAGEWALTVLAYEEAARSYETALDALELVRPGDDRTRCELLLSLGEAESATDRLAAKEAFLAAAEIARHLHLAQELAHAAAGYGGHYLFERAGPDDRLVALLEEGLAGLADEDVELRARLLARLSGALRGEPSRDRRDGLSREAVELARRAENAAALAYALDGRAHAILAPDTTAELLAVSTELLELAERTGNTEQALHGHTNRFMVHVMIGDIRQAELDLDAVGPIADELGKPAHLWQANAFRIELALAGGRLIDAESLLPEMLALGGRAQPDMAVPIYRAQRYMLCDFRSRLDGIEAEMHDLAAAYPDRLVFRCVVAHLQARLGRRAEARQALADLARDDFAAVPFDAEWLYALSLLAETSVLLEDADTSAVLYRLLLPWADLNAADHPEGIRGSVSRYLGLLATTMEQWADAERHFEDAIAMNERMGARPWLAHTQHDYAEMLVARGHAADRDRAEQLHATAAATYDELGMARR
jgi:DNA-binding SARP family transcriptional activator